MSRLPLFALLTLLLTALPSVSSSHGTRVTWTTEAGRVEIRATYDDGSAMGEAQVTVYSPVDPSTPWLTGVTEQDGSFSFEADTTLEGTWDVQVRRAGHGDIAHINVRSDVAPTSASGGERHLTVVQIVVMSASVVWGFVGTALFFVWRVRSRDART